MIEITASVRIPDSELHFEFVRASGPGGQNVNKVATAVQLRFDVAHSPSLPEAVRARLRTLAGRRLSTEGVLILDARRFRTQERNRQDALQRFVELVRQATVRPRKRVATKPSRAARQRRLEGKRKRSAVKRMRRRPADD